MLTDFDAGLFFRALGLAFVIEGVLWAGFPGSMREAMSRAVAMPDRSLRLMGLSAMAAGLFVGYVFG